MPPLFGQRMQSRWFCSPYALPEVPPLNSADAHRGADPCCCRPPCLREDRLRGPCGPRTEALEARISAKIAAASVFGMESGVIEGD